jgi:hypothetical protein
MAVTLVLMTNPAATLMAFCCAPHHVGMHRGGYGHLNEPEPRGTQNDYRSHARHSPHRLWIPYPP